MEKLWNGKEVNNKIYDLTIKKNISENNILRAFNVIKENYLIMSNY